MPGPEAGLRRGRFGLTTGEIKARFILPRTGPSPKDDHTTNFLVNYSKVLIKENCVVVTRVHFVRGVQSSLK